jgi:membrane-associated phospholipid phosphatase
LIAFICGFKIAFRQIDRNSFVKQRAVFYWTLALVVVAIIIGAAFYCDTFVVAFMSRHQTPTAWNFMRNVSRFGDWPTHLLVGIILFGIARLRRNKTWARIFLSMIIALAIAGLIGRAVKVTTGRARPSVKSEQRWIGPTRKYKYHSFPSGHVDASMGFFGVLILVRRRIGLACLPIPMLIGFSRMYLGAHYLSDVVCAAFLGILTAFLVALWLVPKSEGEH